MMEVISLIGVIGMPLARAVCKTRLEHLTSGRLLTFSANLFILNR